MLRLRHLCLPLTLTAFALLWAQTPPTSPFADATTTEQIQTSLNWTRSSYAPSISPLEYTLHDDPRTHFRSLVAEDPESGDIIVAFRGTYSVNSAASSLALNYPQYRSQEFLDTLKQVRELLQQRDNRGRVIITGHSSGGGLAEAFSYRLMEILAPQYRDQVSVNVFTWNGIGSREWFRQTNPKFSPDPAILSRINAHHFRNEHDLVSKFGRRFTGTEWSWSDKKTNFVRAHRYPLSASSVERKGITATQVEQRLRFLSDPLATRTVMLGTSNFLISSAHRCQVILSKVSPPKNAQKNRRPEKSSAAVNN
ncbi:MAG TPA: hypothetical protein VM901_00510 [Bdellovibrionota bacterium]|jgi:hypothetical protein|nr:hypothetical protein [Bdellovibrionota bacterium]